MNRIQNVLLVLIMLMACSASAQVMTAHYDEHDLKFDLESLDSLTFSEESFIEPAAITLSVNTEGSDAGGAIWMIEVSAMVADENVNPVLDGMPVNFSLVENIASISNATTGNESFNDGLSTPGVAHTAILYNSINTNSEVTINCSVLGSEGQVISASMVVTLPIQNPNIELNSDLGNWFFGNNPAAFQANAYVYDGHNHAINNELVRFITDSGEFHTLPNLSAPVNPEMYTGDPDEYPDIEVGWARRYLLIPFEEAFIDPAMLQTLTEMKAILPNQGIESNIVELNLAHDGD